VNAERQPQFSQSAPRQTSGDREAAPRVQIGEHVPVGLIVLERLDILVIVLTLFACLTVYQEPLTWDYAGLASVTAILSGRFITAPDLRRVLTYGSSGRFVMPRLMMEWGMIVGMLMFAGFALNLSDWFSRNVLLAWFAVTTVALAAVQELQIRIARWMNQRGALASRFVIVGINSVGLELHRRLPANGFLGFFDFRKSVRTSLETEGGNSRPPATVRHCDMLGNFVLEHGVASVYIALPIANAPRIQSLLSDLRNSTSNVYFVPDVFAFDLIQARVVDVNGMPALAVCDTPMRGTNALSKRITDTTLALIGIILLSPLLLAIAIGIKLSSPGPVLFKQRRYGMDGEEILVYKFRSMTVCEDGLEVRQASVNDQRVTRFGAFLRRTSMDELPQLVNVLEGKMSLVGPRPHAIAHNELYRRQIDGYMVRHKVLPGITGWAQVHGLRGETDTVEKMALRIRYDLDYLNNWSLWLDLRILVLTVGVVLRGKNAY